MCGWGEIMAVTSEGLALEAGVELITPTEAARLPGTPRNSAGDEAPVPRPELAHQSTQHRVLIGRPRALHFSLATTNIPTNLSICESHGLDIISNTDPGVGDAIGGGRAGALLFFDHGGFEFGTY